MIDRNSYLRTRQECQELQTAIEIAEDQCRKQMRKHNIKIASKKNKCLDGTGSQVDPERERKGMTIIKKMSADGYTLKNIADHLNKLGILTPTGYKYSHQSVHRIRRKIIALEEIGCGIA